MSSIKRWAVAGPLERWPIAPTIRAARWLRTNRRTLRSSDLGLGLIAALLTLGAALRWKETREQATDVYTAGAALGAALLAVALTAMSILVALLDSDYLLLLRSSKGSTDEAGLRQAFRPYKVVAVVSALGLANSATGALVNDVVPWWCQALIMALVVGFSTWAAVGTVELVNITARHGEMKARLFHIKDQIRDKRAEAERSDEP